MAVAHDTFTRFPAGTASDTTTGDRSFTHTPVGTPKGVLVGIGCTGTTRPVTGVTYGGNAMTAAVDANDSTEPGSVWWYRLLNTSIPTGAQTVVLQGCLAAAKYCVAITLTASADNVYHSQVGAVGTTVSANPSISIVTPVAATSYAAFHSGNAAPVAAGTGCTLLASMDYGALMSMIVRRTADAEAAGTIVLSTAAIASDDWCAAAIAVSEVIPVEPIPSVTFARERT